MKSVTIISDGACSGNPGPGGWAALLRFGDKEKMISGSEKDTTNNRMELMAAIEGLRALKEKCRVEMVVDSRYVMDAFEKGWLVNWHRNGWKTADKKPVKNQELWVLLHDACSSHNVSWRWVKGHSGDPDNERVDAEARRQSESAR